MPDNAGKVSQFDSASNPQLKPCPFCGGEAVYVEDTRIGFTTFHDMGNVTCDGCGRSDGFVYKTREAAANSWNTRTPVAVKPLDWDAVHGEYVETYQATCPFGFYRIFEDEDSAAGALWIEFAVHEDRFCMVDAVQIDRGHGEFDEAKKIAQADYERRILSCLVGGGE